MHNAAEHLRIGPLTRRLGELQIDAMLVTDETNVGYLSGFSGDSSYLLIEPSRATILTDGRYQTQISEECPNLRHAVRPPGQAMIDLVEEIVAGTDLRRIGFEAAHVSVASFAQLREKIPGPTWVETTGVVESQRMIKDSEEIEITRHAVRIAERSFRSVVAKLRSSWSEREIAHELESTMRSIGASGVSFPPIVAAGASGALPHYTSSGQMIGQATTLLIDWGAFYKGYASDITRTLHRDHASDRFRRAYDAVLHSQQAAIEAIRPGVEARRSMRWRENT